MTLPALVDRFLETPLYARVKAPITVYTIDPASVRSTTFGRAKYGPSASARSRRVSSLRTMAMLIDWRACDRGRREARSLMR
jgi:hypothetical protein